MSRSFSYDVFLSHNSKDKPRVRQLAERLKKAGLKVWFDEWVIKPGEIIALKVDEGLEQSRVLLLCVSQNALDSSWVALERSTTIHRDPANAGRRFVPLLLEECELPDTLRRYKYVDWRKDEGAEADATLKEVVEACREETPFVQNCRDGKLRRVPKRTGTKKKGEETAFAILKGRFQAHDGEITSLTINSSGTQLVSASVDAHIGVWDRTSFERKIWISVECEVNSASQMAGGKRIVAGEFDGHTSIWDASTGKRLAHLHLSGLTEVWPVVAMRDGLRFLAAGVDSAIYVCDYHWGECLYTIDSPMPTYIYSLAVSPDERLALSGNSDGTIGVFDLRNRKWINNLDGHKEIVHAIQIAPNGEFAVSASEDKTIKIWSLRNLKCLGTLEGFRHDVTSLAIRPDCKTLAAGGFREDPRLILWDLQSGRQIQSIKYTARSCPTSMCFSPDGSQLFVGTYDGRVMVYDLESQKQWLTDDGAKRYTNAKVVLIGEGSVGKTSLAHRLIEDRFVIKDRTHGMNVWPLSLPLPPDATLEREALLWDLAGQEDFRLIHRLFLAETALALLCINPQKEDPFAEAGDWLKSLKTAAANDTESKRESDRLLVFSQIDVGGLKLGDAKIERFCAQHRFKHWLLTSAKTGENCSDVANAGKPSRLKELIAASISWDRLPWTSTPRLLAELKNAVMTMRDKADIRLLRISELTQRLEQALPEEEFRESDVRTAVTLLSNHGLARFLKFGDLVLLRPELLNGYAGAIIRAARAHTDEIGCVLEKDVYGDGFDFTGVERLKRADEELLLHALVQVFLDHSMCIAEETAQGRHLVFPSQYRREKDSPRDPDILVSYTFDGEWQTIWTTLVVRLWYSQEFGHHELWRNAAEFASPKGYTLGLKIDNKQGEGTATVSLYFDKEVDDDLKAIFIEYFHRHLVRYGCDVKRDRRYVCPECGKAVSDLEAVRKRLEAKKDFITCQECDERVPLTDFIEQRLKSDPIARKIMAMEKEATRELDTQSLEQILIGHMMAISGEANQIFRPVTMFDYGIDGEVEFKDDDGKASGKRIYIQLKSGNSYLRTRKGDGTEVFDMKDERHLNYWVNQPVDVYLVIRQTDERTGNQAIRWMNVTRYLKARKGKDMQSRQIVFTGEKLDFEAVYRVRDGFFPKSMAKK